MGINKHFFSNFTEPLFMWEETMLDLQPHTNILNHFVSFSSARKNIKKKRYFLEKGIKRSIRSGTIHGVG